MGSAVSSITDAVGLTNHGAQEAAQDAANRNAAFSQAMTKEQLEFQREQYDDWKEVYGDLQDNLGEYYNNLDPADYEARGLQTVQQEFQLARDRTEAQLAQRGLSTSGIQAAADVTLEADAAGKRAAVRMNAPEIVAKEKQGFLGLGLGQGTQMLGIQAGVANAGAGNAAGLAGSYLSQSTQFGLANQSMMGDLIGTGAGFAAGKPGNLFG